MTRNLDHSLFRDGMAVLLYDVAYRQLCIAIDLPPFAAWQYGLALVSGAGVIAAGKFLANASGQS